MSGRWNIYTLTCYHGTATTPMEIQVMAQSWHEAFARVRALGYVPENEKTLCVVW